MKKVFRLLLLSLAALTIALFLVLIFAQQPLLNQITKWVSKTYGVTTNIDNFNFSLTSGIVTASTIRIASSQGRIVIDDFLLDLSLRSLFGAKAEVSRFKIGSLELINIQELAQNFSKERKSEASADSGFEMPITLNDGQIERIRLDERLPNGSRVLVGNGNITLVSTPAGGISLKESLFKISLVPAEGESLHFGDFKGSQIIEGRSIRLKDTSLSGGLFAMTAEDLQITPELRGELHAFADAGVSPYHQNLEGNFRLAAIISGTLAAPRIEGKLSSDSPVRIGKDSNFDLIKLQAVYRKAKVGQELSINELIAEGPSGRIEVQHPLTYKNGNLSGALNLRLASLTLPSFGFQTAAGNIVLQGTLERPAIDSQITVSDLYAGPARFGTIVAESRYEQASQTLNVSLQESSNSYGMVDAHSSLQFGDEISQSSRLEFERVLEKPKIIAKGTLTSDGPLTLLGATLNANVSGTLEQQSVPLPFVFTAAMKNGVIESKLLHSEVFKANARVLLLADGPSTLDVALSQPKLSAWIPGVACGKANAEGNFLFDVNNLASFSGELKLGEVSVGCGRFAVAVSGPPLRMAGQTITIPTLKLQSLAGDLNVKGQVSRENIKTEILGDLDLTFLGHVIDPIVDSGGIAKVNLRIEGEVSKPSVNGSVKLSKVKGSLQNPIIDLSEVDGSLLLNGTTVHIESLNGKINEGRFSMTSDLDLRDPIASLQIGIIIDNMALSPIPDSEIWLSTEATIHSQQIESKWVPLIDAKVTINDGVIEKQFDRQFIQERILTWLSDSSLGDVEESEGPDSPEMNIQVTGDGSLLLKTNFARADLSPNVTVKGNPSSLKIGGSVGIPSGSFDVGRTHFEIISGSISLWRATPSVQIIAEAESKDLQGFPVNITMEISGEVNDPTVILTSDSGQSQEEIIRLLAAGGGGGFTTQSIFDEAISAAGFKSLSILPEDSLLGRIARIDELSVEPSYDLATGSTGSKLVTANQMLEDLKLTAEFPFSGQAQQSMIALDYTFLPFLGIKGSYRPPNSAIESSSAFDLIWTVLADKPPRPIEFEGNAFYNRHALFQVLGLSARSRMSVARFPPLQRKLLRYYQDRGFLDVSVELECVEASCARGRAKIVEGERYFINEIKHLGNIEKKGTESANGAVATKARLEAVRQHLIREQREQGFFRARILARYVKQDSGAGVRLEVGGWQRQRYGFELSGSRTYGFHDFANSMRLYEQTFPFGPNLPQEFITAVEQYYLERGFADLGVVTKLENKEDVILLSMQITEGHKINVEKVRLENSPLSHVEITAGLSQQEIKNTFSPPVLYRAAVQQGKRLLQKQLRSLGYPKAEIEAEEIRLGADKAEVVYTVLAGEAKRFVVVVEGMPADVTLPPELQAARSIDSINRQVQRLEGRLKRAGFREAALKLELNPAEGKALVLVSTGTRTLIRKVEIVGNEKADREIILRALNLPAGSAMSTRALAQARTRLLKRGLFSEVTMSSDEATGVVIVAVRERTLRSLELTTGFDSAYGLHFGIDGIDRTLLGDGKELSIRGDVYWDQEESKVGRAFSSLRFKDPYLSERTSWIEELVLLNDRETSYQEFDLDSVSLNSSLEFTATQRLKLKGGHRAELLNTRDAPSDIILSNFDQGSLSLSSLFGGVAYIDQDDPLNPRFARRLDLDGAISASELGSEADYGSFLPSFTFLQPTGLLDNRLSVLFSAKAGAHLAFEDTDEIPLAKRFRLGGLNSVRGYRENSLGPRGSLDHVIGGDRYYQASGELRYELIQNLSSLIFLDVGSVWLQSFGARETSLGTGFGVRYASPIGSLGADIGFPLNSDIASSPRFYLRLGATF